MTGKYNSRVKFEFVRFRRAMLRGVLRGLASWKPLDDPRPGYTILIGCNAPLAEMLAATLRLLSLQDLTHCDGINIVFDRPAEELAVPIESRMRQQFPQLPLNFLFYTPREAKRLGKIGLPFCYSWFSWTKGMLASRTRHIFLHDFDAMLIRRDIIAERYKAVIDSGAEWCGIRSYDGNGISKSDHLVTTFEMMLDQQFVRQHFAPIDAFNHVTIYKGKSVDFDTFLYCQTVAGRSLELPIAEEDMVHPSQVIHQFTEMTHRHGYVPPAANNLLMIPYFLFVAERPQPMYEFTAVLKSSSGRAVPFFGKQMDLSNLTRAHVEWLTKQGFRLDNAVAGYVRDEVRTYFDTLSEFLTRQGN